jgi:hypothetical protein
MKDGRENSWILTGTVTARRIGERIGTCGGKVCRVARPLWLFVRRDSDQGHSSSIMEEGAVTVGVDVWGVLVDDLDGPFSVPEGRELSSGLKTSSASVMLVSALEAKELEQLVLSALSSGRSEWSVTTTLINS